MPVVFKEDNPYLPTFQFEINKNLYPTRLEQILFREAKNQAELFCADELSQYANKVLIYTTPLLEADPENFYALYFQSLAEPYCEEKNWYDASYEAICDYKKTVELAKEKLGLTDEFYAFLEESAVHFCHKISFRNSLQLVVLVDIDVKMEKLKKQFKNASTSDPLYQEAKRTLEEGERDFKKICNETSANFEKILSAIFKVLYDILNDQPIEKLSGKSFDAITWIKHLKEVAAAVQSSTQINFFSISTQHKQHFDTLCDKKLVDIHEWRVSKYWEAHPKEKEEFENDIIRMKNDISNLDAENASAQQTINAEIAEEEKKIEILNSEFETNKSKILDEINSIQEDKSKQGLFAFGAKKELKNKIADKQSEIDALEKQHSAQLLDIKEKINSIKDKGYTISSGFSEKISGLKQQINNITNILNNKEE